MTVNACLVVYHKDGTITHFHKRTFPEIRFKTVQGERISKQLRQKLLAFALMREMMIEAGLEHVKGSASSSDSQR